MRARRAGLVGVALALCVLTFAGSAHALPSSGHFKIVLDDLSNISPFVGFMYRTVAIEADYTGTVALGPGTVSMDLLSEGVTGVSSRLGDLAMGDVTIKASGVGSGPFDVAFEVDVPFFNLYGFVTDNLGEWHNQVEPANLIAADGGYSAGPVSIGWYHKETGGFIRVGSIELTSLQVADGGNGATHSPEPATLLLMGAGLVGAAGARRRSRRRA